MESRSPRDAVLDLVRRAGYVRVRDLQTQGLHPEYLRRLVQEGELVRAERGLYVSSTASPTEYHSLAIVAARVPRGVVCLLTALRFHELGSQNPKAVWLAIDRRAGRPRLDYPPLRIVRFSAAALTRGVETHSIEGVAVRVTTPTRTVVDCFKYRNKIGLDVAVEALRALRSRRGFRPSELWSFANLQRVANVIRPYIEAVS